MTRVCTAYRYYHQDHTPCLYTYKRANFHENTLADGTGETAIKRERRCKKLDESDINNSRFPFASIFAESIQNGHEATPIERFRKK